MRAAEHTRTCPLNSARGHSHHGTAVLEYDTYRWPKLVISQRCGCVNAQHKFIVQLQEIMMKIFGRGSQPVSPSEGSSSTQPQQQAGQETPVAARNGEKKGHPGQGQGGTSRRSLFKAGIAAGTALVTGCGGEDDGGCDVSGTKRTKKSTKKPTQKPTKK